MDSAREERMQQRLRGAQRHQVKDVDFQLSFPVLQAPEEPVVSNPNPIQPELPPQPSSRRTPATRSQVLPVNDIPPSEIRPQTRSGNIDANTSVKRRKLDTDETLSSGRSTRSARAAQAPRPDIYELPREEPQEITVTTKLTNSTAVEQIVNITPERTAPVRRTRSTRTPSVIPQTQEEITESPINAPGSGQRKIITSAAQRTSSQLRIVQDSSPSKATQRIQSNRSDVEIPQSPILDGTEHLGGEEGISSISINDEVDELSPSVQTSTHTRKRKSILGDKTSDKENNRANRISSPIRPKKRTRRTEALIEQPSVPEADELSRLSGTQEVAEEIDDLEAAIVLKKHRGERTSKSAQAETSSPLERSEPIQWTKAKTRRGKHRNVSSPVVQRQPKLPTRVPVKTAAKSDTQKPKRAIKKARLRGGSPIPVIVHRLTEQPMFDNSEPDAELLNSEIPHTKRVGVNAIDVLSQVCQEIISVGLETLENGAGIAEDPALRREYKTKWEALLSFGENLQTRFLAHTVNLDNVYSLEKRVREEQKRKLFLRDEIIRVREERQNLALRMDEVRIKHENATKKARDREALNNAAHDIELAVDRGKSQHDDGNETTGIEVLLKRMASTVSTKGSSGGVLQQIKDFNGFLERAALALESKQVWS
ncbi:hypothetical protein BGZ60DRAFT_462355 [Tricladium varicosporioides]|nr:hypothetical protein BGZ60DRAFT_462355 [Hymenoscyphus varicosporioides]